MAGRRRFTAHREDLGPPDPSARATCSCLRRGGALPIAVGAQRNIKKQKRNKLAARTPGTTTCARGCRAYTVRALFGGLPKAASAAAPREARPSPHPRSGGYATRSRTGIESTLANPVHSPQRQRCVMEAERLSELGPLFEGVLLLRAVKAPWAEQNDRQATVRPTS